VNVATRDGGSENVLPEVLRRLLGPSTGQLGIRHYAQLVRDDELWRPERVGEPTTTGTEVAFGSQNFTSSTHPLTHGCAVDGHGRVGDERGRLSWVRGRVGDGHGYVIDGHGRVGDGRGRLS
jgi:hypothetical protein